MRKNLSLLLLITALAAGNASAAKITIVNIDGPNIGFNDKTAATPVGGNPGTTLGEQRLNVFQRAAEMWGSQLESNVEILIDSSFAPRTSDCEPTSGVLASAGPTRITANFKNAPLENVWYPIALANKLAGEDLAVGVTDIKMTFNSAIGTPTCLSGTSWYHGFDNNQGGKTNLLVTVLHEMTHGLGMTGAVNPDSGALRQGLPHVFEVHTIDVATGTRWDHMTDQQRLASFVNTGNIVWDGESVRSAVPAALKAAPFVAIKSGNTTRNFEVQPASFGQDLTNLTISGQVVQALDQPIQGSAGSTPSTFDGCTALTNAAAVSGKWALVDRGGCNFTVKALEAQKVGAIGVIVVNNVRDTCDPPPMGGADDLVTIPAIGIRPTDGDVIKNLLKTANVEGTVQTDPTQLAGATKNGQIRLYAPCQYSGGSSIHHWDEGASPNLLMEPYLDNDVPVGTDITLNFMLDIGWGQGGPRTGRRALRRR